MDAAERYWTETWDRGMAWFATAEQNASFPANELHRMKAKWIDQYYQNRERQLWEMAGRAQYVNGLTEARLMAKPREPRCAFCTRKVSPADATCTGCGAPL